MAKTKFSLEDFKPKKAEDSGAPRSVLIYGPPKRGKSTLAASICEVPGYERVLVLDVEGGSSAISNLYPQVDVQVADSPEFLDYLLQNLVDGKIVEPDSGLPYQAVIIDTIDKAQERKIDWADKQPEAYSAQSGKKDHFHKWAVAKAWMQKLTDMTHMAPFLTIFVAHVIVDKDEDTGKILETVALGGNAKYTFSATPDVVGYFDITKETIDGKKQSIRTIDFTLSERRITGQRYGDKLSGKIAEPTMEKIFRKIRPKIFDKE